MATRHFFVVVVSFMILTAHGMLMSSNPSVTTLTTSNNGKGEDALALSTYMIGINTVVPSPDVSEFYFSTGSLIRKIRKNGTLETIAGNGQASYDKNNNGGKAIEAYLNYPNYLLLDESNGDLYFSDKENFMVRKIDYFGNIYDIAGLAGSSGIVDGDFSVATFAFVTYMAFYGPNKDIIVTDSNCVRVISLLYSNVTTVFTGKESDRFFGVTVSSQGDVYFSDVVSNNILKLSTNMSTATVIAGGGVSGFRDGPALDSLFDYPHSMALKESTQELFISANKRIRVLNLQTLEVSTIVGGIEKSYQSYILPNFGLNVSMGNNGRMNYNSQTNSIYIIDDELFIRKVNLTSEGYWTNIIAGSYITDTVYGITYSKSAFSGYTVGYSMKGDSFFATSQNSVIQFSNGITSLLFEAPVLDFFANVVKPGKDCVYFNDRNSLLHQKFYNGSYLNLKPDFDKDNIPISQSVAYYSYNDIHFEKNGDLYLCNGLKIRKVSGETGIISTIYTHSAEIYSVLVLDNGDVLFSDHYTIRRVESKYTSTIIVGIPGVEYYGTNGEVLGTETASSVPKSLTFNPFDGLLYYCEHYYDRIRTYNFTSKMVKTFTGSAGSGYLDGGLDVASFRSPISLTLDLSTGFIYVADRDNYIIRRIANGIVSTIAGTLQQYGSDDGPLDQAKFDQPYSISTIDGDNFFIIDYNGIRKISLSKGRVETLGTYGTYGDNLQLSKENTRTHNVEFMKQSPYTGDLFWNEIGHIRKADNLTKIVSTVTYKMDNQPIHYSITDYNAQDVMEVNSKGDLIMFDSLNSRIRKLDKNGILSVLVGNGLTTTNYTFSENMNALDFEMWAINGITVCPDDIVYWVDRALRKILRLNEDGTVSTVTDEGNYNLIMCTKFGSFLYIDDNKIYKYANNKTSLIVGHTGNGYNDGPLETAQLDNIYSVSVSLLDNSILVNENSKQLRRIGCDDGFEMQDDYTTCLIPCYGKGLNACSGRGQCVELNNCSCPNGWAGLECEIPICYGLNGTDACNGPSHGVCSTSNNCTCSKEWTGQQCEIPVCFGMSGTSSCGGSSQGTCSSPNNCVCQNGWSGQECKTPICFGLNGTQACNGPSHGSCYLPNNCTCYSNWYGSQCQIPICYGLNGDGACNGPTRGSCVSPNNCSCSNDNEWTGQQCEIPICYGLSGKDTCNGKGTCSSPNNCTCLPGYYGADCSKFDCFGIEKSFPNVCSNSNGKCTSPNNCSCSTGWIGKECETFTCFGLNGTDACGGSTHGICSAPNNCTCANKEWTGQQCGLPVCFGLSGSNACSGGKGICLSPNTCTCLPAFTGQQCETSPSPSASLRIVNSSKTIRYPGTPVLLVISFALFLLIPLLIA